MWRCQKLGPSAPNISSAHRKWFCWCHILHFSTSRHFFVSKICHPLFWQQRHCYVGCPQEYTWDKGQHLLLMINVADWNIVSHLLSPQPVLFKIKKLLHSYFPLIVPSYLDLSNWYIPATYSGKNVFFTFVLIKDIGICSTDELLVLAWLIEHISLW